MAQDEDLERRLTLSALMDGEADASAVSRGCAAWRDDAGLRASWHAWHVAGDVMRSEDLAFDARRDDAFLAAVCARLAEEPVVVAPMPLEAPAATPLARHRARRMWSGAAAVAGGFAVVVGAVVSIRGTDDAAPRMAAAPAAPAAQPVAVSRAEAPAEPQVLVVNGELIRDARLDRYLAAHKPLGGNPALVMPSSFGARADAR